MQEEADLLAVGRWVFLQSVASTLKCFSLQHICPKWSLIAHWRMHDIKCLQTWNNHVLSLLEIVCSGFVFTTMLNKTEVLTNHIRRVSHLFSFVRSCQLYKCERLYLFCWYICLCYCSASWKLWLPLRCKNALKPKLRSQHRAGELEGFTVAILPSICLLGWISVELQYFLIVGNFCTVLLK